MLLGVSIIFNIQVLEASGVLKRLSILGLSVPVDCATFKVKHIEKGEFVVSRSFSVSHHNEVDGVSIIH